MNVKIAAVVLGFASCALTAGLASADGMVEPEVTTAQAQVQPQTQAAPPAPTPEPAARAAQPAERKAPSLTATLVDAEAKAQKHWATVQVQVGGIKIVDPALAHETPKAGQGHLHYKVDDGPAIATTATKLSFHDLKSGPHTIMVMLAGNDHSPLGPSQTLNVTIP